MYLFVAQKSEVIVYLIMLGNYVSLSAGLAARQTTGRLHVALPRGVNVIKLCFMCLPPLDSGNFEVLIEIWLI